MLPYVIRINLAMLPILTVPDLKEVARRERYKTIELERRCRLFDAKRRQIGIDSDALRHQIEEKKEREKAEKLDEVKFLQKQKLDNVVFDQLKKKEDEQRKRIERQVNEYRQKHQRYEDRREFDLNDPNRLKKEIFEPDPNDERFGISSMQRFEGTDDLETNEIRKKIVKDQQQSWLLQQMLEKEKAKKDVKLADEIYEEANESRNQRYLAMKQIENECRKKLEIATKEYNRALAVKKVRAKIDEMRVDMEDEYTHKINQITSEFLSETKDPTSALSPGRTQTTMFKGMSEEKLKEIRRAQMEQIEEKKARKRLEELEERYYQTYQANIQKSLQIADALRKQNLSQNGEEFRNENKKLMDEHKAKLNYLNKVVYTNRPTQEYFSQFNSSTR